MFYEKKKHKLLKLSLILIFSAAVGMFLGYASVRYENFPFTDFLSSEPDTPKTETPIEIPTPEPIYTNAVENNITENDSSAPTPPATEAKPEFIVKSDGTKVCLYKIYPDGKTEEEQVLPINLNALKKEDRKILEGGITVKNKQELASVLEDFGS